MPAPLQIQFSDRIVTYETFLDDLATRLHSKIKEEREDPEYVSQLQAYKLFGRANVMRWRRTGKITPAKRPGKCEYSMAELRLLQQTKQDYFK